MSERVLFDKSFSCDDVAEIKDILVVFSPTIGKSKGIGEQLVSPIIFKSGEIVNINLCISVET